ncbi:glutamine amidotransferase-related protein [Ruegeria profundi]|uniref:Glutamine amidotransferase domain-containing protein n=1 Tax=Ruegeria profundi TaxID=1685378 RepID=A0A0X3TN53_9RHOB|nr:hypothetical protein [Ruegeria profundi]KUJ77205.1 hypothetical protein AVO44_18550 [Ruegeria profundi]
MRLATLVTNTDFSAFAKARPLDDEKFATLIAEVRPDLVVTAFWVCRGEFPEDISAVDGVMTTGSPASVTENAPWMQQLEVLIKDIIERKTPVFGACFGHQIIAKTLSATVVRTPNGWAHGLIETNCVASRPWSDHENRWNRYGSHIEQVGALPDGACQSLETGPADRAEFAAFFEYGGR